MFNIFSVFNAKGHALHFFIEYTEILEDVLMYKLKEMIFISPLKKNILKYGAYISILILGSVIFSVPHYLIDVARQGPGKRETRFPMDLKYILLWKPLKNDKVQYLKESELFLGQRKFIKQKCRFINCYITYNKYLLRNDHRNFDAVVFNARDFANLRAIDVNLTRSPHQKYVFHSLGPATKYPLCNPAFDGFFNWTWTYKLDSDIVHPFFNIFDDKKKLVGPARIMNWTADMKHEDRLGGKIRRKDKAVVLVVTKCGLKEKYQEFIREFRREIKRYNYTLDVYGPCGDIKCPNNRLIYCHKLIDKKYFFQLILEDTIAKDYVTERIGNAMKVLAIPIVLGKLNYNSFMPPGSYIDYQTLDMKKLGAIIDYLIKNPKIYEYFFDWKRHYFYTPKSRTYLCDLCAELNSNTSVSSYKTYNELREWWNPNFRHSC